MGLKLTGRDDVASDDGLLQTNPRGVEAASYGKYEEKTPPFTAGMNPTTPPQPPELSPLTAYVTVAQRAKTGGWIGVRPDDEGHHTVPERASPRPWRHGRQKATLARLCLPTVVVRKTRGVFRDERGTPSLGPCERPTAVSR